MNPVGISRDEEAVSAAVATVLMFGGVITIIGIMLLSLVPVIQELEGAVKRHDMQSQMSVMAHEITMLSESGVPGDRTSVELIPVDGELSWDRTRGGMWYSASWYEDDSFRIRNVLDLDRDMEFQHPEGKVEALCYDDLRLGPDRHHIFSPVSGADTVIVTPKHGLTIPFGPVVISQGESTYSLNVGDVVTLDADTTFTSSHDLSGLVLFEEGGSTIYPPSKSNPATGEGRHWAIPMPVGNSVIELFSNDDMLIQWSVGTDSGTEVAIQTSALHLGNSWTKSFEIAEESLLEISTNSDARLLLMTNSSGRTTLIGTDGSPLSKEFVIPHTSASITITNPSALSSTITWKNDGIPIPAGESRTIEWPPSEITTAAILKSNNDAIIEWNSGPSGINQIVALDTGRFSGAEFRLNTSAQEHDIQISGYETEWNQSDDGIYVNTTSGDSLSILRIEGQNGMLVLKSDGQERCVAIDITASGWITTELPWVNLDGRRNSEIVQAWRNGSHPASLEIRLIGTEGDSTHSTLSTAWAFHLSRLTYEFDSSINGLEVAWSAGAVVTNHPELEPTILVGPADRGGPGPRFSATVPSMHPTAESASGSGNMELELELVMRESLASHLAHDVRRGWQGPYGDAVATWSSKGLEESEDWIVNPSRVDLLDDYVGWVPIPSHGPSEAVWHSGGEPIQFNLQISSIDVHITEGIS